MTAKILSVIVAPAVFWLLYHVYKDRYRPEPPIRLGIAFFLGSLAGFLCLEAYRLANRLGAATDPFALAERDPFGFFVYAVLAVGVVEEVAKFLPFALICLRFREFDERIDGLIYASAVGLGFAAYENLVYMQMLTGPALLGRALASPLVHAMFASIWGDAVARARFEGRSIARASVGGLALAAVVHGIYDFVVLAVPASVRPIAAAIVLAIWIWRIRLIQRLQREARE